MNRAELKAKAKSQIKAPFWTLVVIMLLTILLCCIPYASMVIVPALSLSMCMIYLKVVRNGQVEISDLFSGFNKLGRAWWMSFLIGLFTSLWSLLLFVPGIIKGYSYSMAYYVLADHPEMTARQAIKESMRIMDGHKMELFVIHLSFIGWQLLSLVTFGLSSFYVTPYMSATVANFYEGIKGPATTYDAEPVYEY